MRWWGHRIVLPLINSKQCSNSRGKNIILFLKWRKYMNKVRTPGCFDNFDCILAGSTSRKCHENLRKAINTMTFSHVPQYSQKSIGRVAEKEKSERTFCFYIGNTEYTIRKSCQQWLLEEQTHSCICCRRKTIEHIIQSSDYDDDGNRCNLQQHWWYSSTVRSASTPGSHEDEKEKVDKNTNTRYNTDAKYSSRRVFSGSKWWQWQTWHPCGESIRKNYTAHYWSW